MLKPHVADRHRSGRAHHAAPRRYRYAIASEPALCMEGGGLIASTKFPGLQQAYVESVHLAHTPEQMKSR
ncbi:hypothetical protein QF002_001400 [Paraburkholderia youngii]